MAMYSIRRFPLSSSSCTIDVAHKPNTLINNQNFIHMTKHLRYLFAALLVWICTVGGYAQDLTEVYSTGFESTEGYTTATTYNGTTTVGPSGKQWYINSGCVSKTSFISGASSIHMRYYKSTKKTPYAQMNFSVDGVSNVTFKGNTAGSGNIKVEYSTDNGTTWVGAKEYTLSSTVSDISYELSSSNINNVRIKITSLITSDKKAVCIDDFKLLAKSGSSSSATPTTTTFNTSDGLNVDDQTFNLVNGKYNGEAFAGYKAACTTDGAEGTIKYTSSEESVATVGTDGALTIVGIGTTEITATFVPNDAAAYATSSAKYTVVNSEPAKTATSLSFGADKDGSTVALIEGLLSDGSDFTGYTATESTGAAGTISYAATGDGVATVDAATGALTVNKTTYGTTTITATFTPNDAETYAASTATYKITNRMDAVFYESFDKCAGTGGNDGKFNGTGTDKALCDNNAWDVVSGAAANKCLKLGTGSKQGSATTPSITLTTGAGLLSFNAAAWDSNSEQTAINVTISNGTLTYNGTTAQTISINDLSTKAWTEYTNIAISATGPFTIKFEAKNTSNNRFFLDEVAVKQTKAKLDPQLSFAEATQTKQMENGGITVPLQTVTKAEGLDAEIKYSLNCESSVAEISGTDILVYKAATIVVTATSAETDNYKAGTASYTLNVTEQRAEDAAFKFDAESYTIDINDADKFDASSKLQNPNGLVVTWSIEPKSDYVVIDEAGNVDIAECGTYTITATGAANDSYLETIATCQLIVKDGTTEEKAVTFVAGVNKGTQTSNGKEDEVNVNPVTMYSENAAFAASTGDVYTYRFYKDGATIISTKIGKITKVEFIGSGNTTSANSLKNFTVDTGDYLCEDNDYGVWKGSATDIVFTASAATYATQIIVTLELPKAKAYTFSDDASTITLENYDNANVTINRKLEADDGWWTLCLPFALDADQMKTYFGDGAQLRTFDSMNGATMNFKAATAMEAGKPYLVKPTKNFDGTTTKFECVQLKADGPATLGTGYAMIGTYHTETLATDGTDLFLGANNKFYKPSEGGNTIKGFRVYFQCPADKVGTPMTANIDGVETAITRIDGEQLGGTTDTRVYNLQGQCVGNTLRGLASGIYVCGGRKVVVK